GDVLAEGLFWLLDEGRTLRDATTAYWRRYLTMRRRFILETIDMVHRTRLNPDRKARMLSSLTAASGRSQFIQPEWCESYVRAWRADRRTWQHHLERFQSSRRQNSCRGDLDKVVAHLGLALQSKHLPARPRAS
ncbi:MAG TPA: hypothetical protein VF821_05065, partial [Lentzea sp.]